MERFNSGAVNAEGLADPYVKLMINEWTRCTKLGVDPARRFGVKCSDGRFRSIWATTGNCWTRHSIHRQGEGAVSGVQACIACGTPKALILYIAGDSSVRDLPPRVRAS